MKIAISGYGRMGHEIEKTALKRGHQIGAILNDEGDWEKFHEQIRGCDVVIDFSWPEAILANIRNCFDLNIPMVTGTTGWNEKLDSIRENCLDKNKAFLYASNFSIGVNILFYLNRKLAEVMNHFDAYTPSMQEAHHIHKLDAPSGTAISLASDMIDHIERLGAWSSENTEEQSTLEIESIREGEINGIHEVKYESDADLLSLRHEAKNRSGFAMGAVIAAEWIKDKKGFFSMKDVLEF